MRILVTGLRGYIGCMLVPRLLAAGHEVVGLDSDLYRDCTFVGEVPAVPTIAKDVRDVESADIAGNDAVIHLAGLSNDPLGDLDPDLTDEVNHRATVRLAGLARTVGVHRFLFASSCSNYGAAGSEIVDESSPPAPVTPYAMSKVEAERGLMALADPTFSPVCLRFGTVYGLSPRIRFDLAVNNLVAWACATGYVQLKSDGGAWRPLIHVEDVAEACLHLLHVPRNAVHGLAFNIGAADGNHRIRDVAAMVAEVVPGCRLAFAAHAAPDRRSYRIDCGRLARNVPQFHPQWTVRQGIESLYNVLHRHPVSVEDFEGARYSRVAHLRRLVESGRIDERLRPAVGGFTVSQP